MLRVGLPLLCLMVVALAACGGDEPPAATPTVPAVPTRTPLPTSTAVPTATATAVPTPRPGADTAPQGTRSGVSSIDAILQPLVGGDVEGLVPFFRMTNTACTHEQGLGGPPKCDFLPGNPPEGTRVEAFPTAGCEGGWAFDVRELAEELLKFEPKLFGVVRFATPQPPYRLEPGYPLMEHLILVEVSFGQNDRQGIVLGVASGAIVYMRSICTGPPERALDGYGVYTVILKGPAYQ